MVGAEILHFEMSWSAASTVDVLGEFNSHTSPKLGVVLLINTFQLFSQFSYKSPFLEGVPTLKFHVRNHILNL